MSNTRIEKGAVTITLRSEELKPYIKAVAGTDLYYSAYAVLRDYFGLSHKEVTAVLGDRILLDSLDV